MQGKSEIIILQ